MYDTATHVKMVKERVRQKQRQKEKRTIFRLSAICVLLSVTLVGLTKTLDGWEQADLSGLYGSMLLHEDAGGYVLVGVLAFSVAVVITVFCIHFREKSKRMKEKQANKEEMKHETRS